MRTKETFILYEPAEDSFLIQKHIKEYAKGTVLEIGTGSGILAETAAQCANVQTVLAVDVQKGVIDHCKKIIKKEKITFKQGDLFSNIKADKFDCIIFNPPYLPTNPRAPDITLDAGKKGYELIERFLAAVNNYLAPDGTVLLLFSSFSKKHIIDEIIKKNLFEAKEIDQQHISFETLYVYAITKSALLKELEKHKITDVHYFAKGKRGLVYKGVYKRKAVVVKIQRPDAITLSTVQFEATWLKKLNPHHIGPTLFFATETFLVMELIEGYLFEEFIQTHQKKDILSMIKKLLQQMYLLDSLGINKYEMNHPDKHIIIRKGIPIMIDFERCRHTEDPKNITQVVQFITATRITLLLEKKGIHVDKKGMQDAARGYKLNRNKKNYNTIITFIR
ncbi:methyltransferase [Candidatus Woesearchaeota archaeon]|nr:methyltransferase [Candidatus Woesearchaeota archaeon]